MCTCTLYDCLQDDDDDNDDDDDDDDDGVGVENRKEEGSREWTMITKAYLVSEADKTLQRQLSIGS